METLIDKITHLRQKKKAVIIAHYYQSPEIQDLADFVGDSLQMAQYALKSDAEIIVVAGVFFMAETAKILNPTKKVLLPDSQAGCSLADSCPPNLLQNLKVAYTDYLVVSYINCSAEIKAMSDLVCTSSNAETIISQLPKSSKIIFVPDKNLGRYLIHKTGRDMMLWNGSCTVHEVFSIDKLLDIHFQHPKAKFIAHPESELSILKLASYVGSTKGMLDFVKNDTAMEYIVATEVGILHQMRKLVPNKTFIPAPIYDENSCSCSECPYMKMNTLQKLYDCLLYENPEIHISEEIQVKAFVPLIRMLQLSV